jgi:hypothetical protein
MHHNIKHLLHHTTDIIDHDSSMAPFLNYFTAAAFVSSSSSSWNKKKIKHNSRPSKERIAKHNNWISLHHYLSTDRHSSSSSFLDAALPDATTTTTSAAKNTNQVVTDDEGGNLSQLIPLLGGSPSHLLRLFKKPEGYRGVYLNEAVQQGDILLQIPLSSCLRDDESPSWLHKQQQEKEEQIDDNNNKNAVVQIQGWVTRLTASLLDAQSNINQLPNKGFQEWLRLMPSDTSLRHSLPIYWSDSILQSTECRKLELAVDSAYFARVEPLADLSACAGTTQAEIEYALDLVQTRAFRWSTNDENNEDDNNNINVDSSVVSDNLRVMVPVFDLINHHYEPNADFLLKGDYMTLRALRDIEADKEVLVHYGSSTMPVWKCLFSYGFIPSIDEVYEHNTAEIVVVDDDVDCTYRFEISPTEIPFELVQYYAQKLGNNEDIDNVEFTPEIGRAIVEQLKTSIKALEKITTVNDDDKNIQNSESSSLSLQLVKDLRESHRRTLVTCVEGLKEYMEGQE